MIYLSLFFFSLAFLWPTHFEPLPLFYQNSFIFLSLMALLVKLRELYIDKLTTIILSLLFVMILFEYLINNIISDEALYFFIAVIVCLIAYVLGVNYRNDLEKIKFFIPVYIATAVVLFIVQIFQIFHIDSVFIKYISATSNRYYSNIGQPNILATIYVTAIAYLNLRKKDIKFFMLISIFVIGIFLTKSRVGYLSLTLCCILSFVYIKQFKIKVFIKQSYPLLLLISMFIVNYLNRDSFFSANRLNNLANRRIEVYKDAINLIGDRPILGYGWGSAHKYIPSNGVVYFKDIIYSYHNIIFDLLLGYGVIITLLFFIIFYNLIWKNRYNSIKYIIISLPFLLHSLVEFPYYYWYFLMPFAFTIGVINTSYLNEKVFFLYRKYVLLATLIFLLVYKFFYDEYNLVTQNYLSIYNGECRDLPDKSWLFFNESAKHIEYFCLKNSNERDKRKIVTDSLKYTLLIDYIDTYDLKNDNLNRYTCTKYSYSCE